MITCKFCGSDRVSFNTSVVMQSKSRSFLWNLLMICFTGGLWLLWMLIRRRKEKMVQVTNAICQNCGSSWRVA